MQIAFGRVRRKTSPARWEIPKSLCSHIFGLYYITQVATNKLRTYAVDPFSHSLFFLHCAFFGNIRSILVWKPILRKS